MSVVPYKYVWFGKKIRTGADLRANTKTDCWCVVPKGNLDMHTRLGEIRWFARWRKYCYFPGAATVYDANCLREIAGFCEQQTKEHYDAIKRRRADQADNR